MPSQIACAALGLLAFSSAAGPLSPPNPPASTTASIDARTPISQVAGDADSAHRITLPGSYYLTSNITVASGEHGIEIATDSVTLDLNGFMIEGLAGSLNGVHMADSLSFDGVRILNGTVLFMDGSGLYLNSEQIHVENVNVRGCDEWGIDAGRSTAFQIAIEDCALEGNGTNPVTETGNLLVYREARVENCIVSSAVGEIGIQAGDQTLITGCTVIDGDIGIWAIGSVQVQECIVSNAVTGVELHSGALVDRCTISRCVTGVELVNRGTVLNSHLNENGVGIQLVGLNNVAEANTIWGDTTDIGIQSLGTANHGFVARNRCVGMTTPYDITDGTVSHGPIIDLPDGSMTGITYNGNPWANFSY